MRYLPDNRKRCALFPLISLSGRHLNKLEGKIALITEASTGIDLATAQHFVSKGASVSITGGKLGEYSDANARLRASCPNIHPKNSWMNIRTNFQSQTYSWQYNIFHGRRCHSSFPSIAWKIRLWMQHQPCRLLFCPTIRPDFRFLELFCPNIHPIYQQVAVS